MTEQITPVYLSFATEHHASDIFIIAGRPLSFKINGKLSIYGERLMPADTEILLRQIYQMSNNRNFDRLPLILKESGRPAMIKISDA